MIHYINKKTISKLFIILLIFLVPVIYFIFGDLPTRMYNFILTIFLLIVLPKGSKVYAILPFIIGTAIPLMQEWSSYLSPKPEVFININRVTEAELTYSNIINITESGTYQLYLISSSKEEAKSLVLRRDVLPADNFYFGFMGSKDKSIPFTYVVHIKNKGAKTKEPVHGNIRISAEKLECSEISPTLDLTCKRNTNRFEPPIFWKTKNFLSEEEQAQFVFRTERFELPEVNCRYDDKDCVLSIYDLTIFEVESFPPYVVLGEKRINIPDYNNEDGLKLYAESHDKWVDYKEVWGDDLSYVFGRT